MNIKKLLLAWVALMVGCVTAVAQLPTATTLVDGQFAPGTKWYTLQIADQGYLISDQGAAEYISLNRTAGVQNKDLWCFVGDNDNGYTIYNKQKGTQFKLATPSNDAVAGNASAGLTAYTLVKGIETETMGDYRHLWKFTTSTYNGGNGFYMSPADNTNQKINKRGDKLAYWTGGFDAGSTVKIVPVEQEMTISLTTGTLSKTDNTVVTADNNWAQYWTSASNTPTVKLDAGQNNMRKMSGVWEAFRGGVSNPRNYTLSVPAGYAITGYSFDFKMQGTAALTVTANGTAKTSTAAFQNFTVTGLNSQSVVAFSLGGTNVGIVLSNFKVTIARVLVPEEASFDVFPVKDNSQVPYRIPAIATTINGNLVAAADYRHSNNDIGLSTTNNGRLDIHARISRNNGQTWEDIFPIVEGKGLGNGFWTAFGDPCIVADRESNKVLVLTCAGDVSFFAGTREHHQGIAYFLSENGGEKGSWSDPIDLEKQFYEPLDKSAHGPVRCMFIGSGKIHQSRYIKVGDYYRLYCSTLVKDVNGALINYVYYSDDFGRNWKVLGDVNTPAIISDANEPKVEELPDGSVVISSRPSTNDTGRLFNIFKFSNAATGEGVWGAQAYSTISNNGTITYGNNTNGEILIVPVKRASDGQRTYLALQSVPYGSGRTNVVIYYKELTDFSKYKNAAEFAKSWDGKYQASYIGSAYTTMTLQKDGNIGFLYEEETYGARARLGYNIVYKNYSIAKITNNKYTISPEKLPNASATDLENALSAEFNTVKAAFRGDIDASAVAVGTETNRYFVMPQSVIDAANANYNAATYPASDATAQKAAIKSLFANIEALHAGVESGYRKPQNGDKIQITSRTQTTYQLSVDPNMSSVAASTTADHRAVWVLEETANKGVFNIYNPYLNRYIGALPSANDTAIPVVSKKEQAGRYEITNPSPLYAALRQFGTSGNNCIHLRTTPTPFLPVKWTESANASHYTITVNTNEFNSEWTPNLRTDLNTAATSTEAQATTLTNGGAQVGEGLGKFHIDNTAITAARTLANDATSLQPALTEAIKNLDNAVGYNLPNPGFYRFKGSVSNKYIDAATAHTSGHAMMNEAAGTNINGIFYLTHDNQLISLATGLFLANSWGVEGYRSAANNVTFALPANDVTKQGKYTLYTGSWLYDNGNEANKNWLDRNGGYAANNCDWILEPVSALPVQVSAAGLTTVYAPVDLRLPAGAKAYKGVVNAENTEVTLTEVENNLIPAFTPVVLEAAQGALELTVASRDVLASEEHVPTTGSFFAGSLDTKAKVGNILTLQNIGGNPGFYNFTGTRLKGFRAFVQLEGAAPTQGLSLNFGNLTAIDALNSLINEAPAAIYDLQGRRHNTLQKGVNIVNGKKIIVQ